MNAQSIQLNFLMFYILDRQPLDENDICTAVGQRFA